MGKFYITTAIDYVNALPHLGHAYEKIAADVIARYHRLRGDEVWFLTGVDEHGTKIEKVSNLSGISPKEHCDRITQEFINTWKNLNISYDDFIRTTQERHKNTVIKIFKKLLENGDIYKSKYEGLYCTGCEGFILEKDLIDGKCPEHQIKPDWISEENYFLNISKYKDKIKEHIIKNPNFILPEIRRTEVLHLIDDFKDISISRESVSWGIPVPGDEKQVIYVWVDALSNYITALGFLSDNDENFKKFWPANVQMIGKDILKFHTIIWPTILMGLGIELPKTIFVHGFVYSKSLKMSKTIGNVIDPNELVEKYKSDAVRYYLLRDIVFGKDGDFILESFEKRVDADIANNLGNALNRILTILDKNFEGIVPECPSNFVSEELSESIIKETIKKIEEYMENFGLHETLITIWNLIDTLNKYIDTTAPWNLAKNSKTDKNAYNKLKGVLYNCLETLRIIAILISPFIPTIASQIWEQLGIKESIYEQRWDDLVWGKLKPGIRTNRLGPIYPRISSKLADKEKKKSQK